jgi:hypothetical protein
MSPSPKLRAGALCIVTATYAATWGCTENFSAGPAVDLDGSADGVGAPDSTAPDASSDGPVYDAVDDRAADTASAPDAAPADAALDGLPPPDGPTLADANDDAPDTTIEALDGAGGFDARNDVAVLLPDAAGADDAGDAADAPLAPTILVTGTAACSATCQGAAGATASQAAAFVLQNAAPYAVHWSVVARAGMVSLDPNGGNLTASPNGFSATSATANPFPGYAPGPTITDTLVFSTDDGHPTVIVPITITFLGYHAASSAIDFGNVGLDASATQHVAVTFNGSCCTAASPDSTSGPFTAVSARSGGVVNDIAITFNPTAPGPSTASFQFGGLTTLEVCSPPIVVTGTGESGP